MAIVCGAQYDEARVLKMQQACRDIGVDHVPFLVADSNVAMPPVGPKYAKMMVSRVKNCLIELEEEGRLEGCGIWYY